MIECVCSFEEEYGFLKSETMSIISELIRCKDCKIKPRCVMYRYNKDPYGFCKWAERKEE